MDWDICTCAGLKQQCRTEAHLDLQLLSQQEYRKTQTKAIAATWQPRLCFVVYDFILFTAGCLQCVQ